MKITTIIKNFINRIKASLGWKKCECKCECKAEPVARLTIHEFANAYGVSESAIRGRVTRHEKKTGELHCALAVEVTKAGRRPVKLYETKFLEDLMKDVLEKKKKTPEVIAEEDLHRHVGDAIRAAFLKGDHDLMDYTHCPPDICDQPVCQSCLRNLKNFPTDHWSTTSMAIDPKIRREGGKCSSYCGFSASMHSKYALY